MKNYQYNPNAPASACIWHIDKRTHSLARRACIGPVRFHLLIASPGQFELLTRNSTCTRLLKID